MPGQGPGTSQRKIACDESFWLSPSPRNEEFSSDHGRHPRLEAVKDLVNSGRLETKDGGREKRVKVYFLE